MIKRCFLSASFLVFETLKILSVVFDLLGTLSNEDGNVNNDGSEKLHFWFALYFFVRAIRVLIFALNFVINNNNLFTCIARVT